MIRNLAKGTAAALLIAALGAAVVALWIRHLALAGLPRIDGSASLPGLSAPVAVDRDALGVPTIRAGNRRDAMEALGYVHAQDRFFQMDLLRRRAAGELSELLGKKALDWDRKVRPHHFAQLADAVLQRATASQRGDLEAYCRGVNAGLSSLAGRPFEYGVLRLKPRPWAPADTLLVQYSLTLTLQDIDGVYKRTLAALLDAYGPKTVAFLGPAETSEDSALDGSLGSEPPIPSAAEIDLRRLSEARSASARRLARQAFAAASNSLAVAGGLTSDGGALVANDMHLTLGVPNTWYRACIEWGGPPGGTPDWKLAGITLPGGPWLVAGSNGKVAWGFTRYQAETGDLIRVSQRTEGYYLGPGGFSRPVETRSDTIAVKGQAPEVVTSRWTVWGPIVGTDADNHLMVYHWMADDPAAADLGFERIQGSTTLGEALASARRAGIPNLNFVAADRSGRIGWTITGRLPRRTGDGYDGRLPAFWNFGDRSWDGDLPDSDVPELTDQQILWTANQRMVGAEAFARLGDGGFEAPARGAQIRDDLRDLVRGKSGRISAADLLSIQLDDRALFLERWRGLLIGACGDRPELAPMLGIVRDHWSGRSETSSAAYLLVRQFRRRIAALVFQAVMAPCLESDPVCDWTKLDYEPALWRMVTAQPPNLLPRPFESWDELLEHAALDTAEEARSDAGALSKASWGRHNLLSMRHPFGMALPRLLSGWIDMPAQPLPGDRDMPRVQGPAFGASERFVVSPGREEQGIFEMPGGQSGNPLSPYYRAGHDAWVRGEPTPFLPGASEHRLMLQPGG